MVDIGEFSRRAADKVLAYQETAEERFNLGLQRPEIEEFVKTVFYASMLPDEGRWPSVTLLSYRKGTENQFHFLFNPLRQPTPQEIAKLAHAVAPDSHICCVSHEGRLSIGGFHVTVLNEMRELGYSSFRVGNPFRLVIRGPGHIEMSTGGISLIYRAGVITAEFLLRESAAMARLVGAIQQELQELTVGTVEALPDIFNDLIRAIARLGHGGMLVVTDCGATAQFSTLKQIDCLLLQNLLLRYWNHVAQFLADVGGAANALNDEEKRRGNRFALDVSSDTSMLEKCISTISRLAGVDGAIVLGYDCRVVAFNAITSKSVEAVPDCRLVDSKNRQLEFSRIVGERGSRHQSGLSYAMRTSGAFVFVISQDGGVMAFHNRGDNVVVCEPGLRVLD